MIIHVMANTSTVLQTAVSDYPLIVNYEKCTNVD